MPLTTSFTGLKTSQRCAAACLRTETHPQSEVRRTGCLTPTVAAQDDLEDIRRKRLEQMKRTANKRQEWLNKGHGEYKELSGEKARSPCIAARHPGCRLARTTLISFVQGGLGSRSPSVGLG